MGEAHSSVSPWDTGSNLSTDGSLAFSAYTSLLHLNADFDGEVPLVALTGNCTGSASNMFYVDLNPPVYPSYEARQHWTLEDYQAYILGVNELQTGSLDERVIASRILFYQDYHDL